MVLFHATGLFAAPKYWGADVLGGLFRFGFSGVMFFFVLSGFVMVHVHRKDIGHTSALPSYFRKRAVRIYPIYWLVSAAVLPLLLFSGAADMGRVYNSVALVGTEAVATLGVAWTLFHEVGFYVLFAALLVSRRLGVVVISIWFMLCLVWFGREPPHYLLDPINLLFGIGMATALALPKVPPSRVLLWGGLAGFLAIGLECSFVNVFTEDWREIGFGVFAAISIAAGVRIEQEGGLTAPRWAIALGDSSYSLYLIHYPLLSILAQLWFATPLRSLPLEAAFVAMVVVCLVAAHLTHVLIERPLLARLQRPPRAAGHLKSAA